MTENMVRDIRTVKRSLFIIHSLVNRVGATSRSGPKSRMGLWNPVGTELTCQKQVCQKATCWDYIRKAAIPEILWFQSGTETSPSIM